MTKVYLAASYLRRAEIDEDIARLYRVEGFDVVSRWHHTHLGQTPSAIGAAEDLDDVDEADAVVVTTEEHGVYNTGGRHFETGYAWAMGKQIVLVGPFEHIFGKGLPRIYRVDTHEEAMALLGRAL